jgi:Fe-S cluster assembly protein SufD
VLFFSGGSQHVDIETETVHAAGNTQSQTIVRSAGTDRGQGRYLGNIKILANAHGADASLRDDALLLSAGAHIDSVPALEIAANDVRAFHGATVGAISQEELFYAETRGIPRAEAERMIALGFFEPAVSRFPGELLRDQIRTALENKLGPKPV